MTLEKAIQVLAQDLDGRLICYPKELRAAKALSIEAMKWMLDVRHIINTPNPELLPGETKD